MNRRPDGTGRAPQNLVSYHLRLLRHHIADGVTVTSAGRRPNRRS
ncbi:hypothetical protein AB0L30_37000 [Microbispora rosea]